MRTLITTILFLTTIQTCAQFDYDLYMSLTTKETLLQHQKISTITEYKSEKKGEKIKTVVQQFLKNGYPVLIFQYNMQGQITAKTEFIYNTLEHIKSIESYKNETPGSSTEFELNHLGQITAYTYYVYSSYDGEKTFVWKTLLEYNPNLTIKKSIKQQGYKRDTSEIVFYNDFGVKTKTIWNMGGLRTTKIEYAYNKDSTEMLEKHYENDTTIYTTIIHRYKDKKEVEKIDPTTSKKPFYWKYDKMGRIIETNEAFFYKTYYTYNLDGFLTNKTLEALFSDSDMKDLPKKIEFIYEYQ
jgi:hypothetical protein